MYDRAVDAFHFTVDSFETSREIAEHYLPIYINHTRENLGPALTKAAQQAQWAWTQAAATGSDALQKVIFSPLSLKADRNTPPLSSIGVVKITALCSELVNALGDVLFPKCPLDVWFLYFFLIGKGKLVIPSPSFGS